MQAARDLVSAAAELSSGMQHGVHNFECIFSCGVLANRHTAAVVDHFDCVVLVDANEDARGMSRHRFVDRVVDDLVDEVVEAALVGRADVHAGALAYGIEPLEHLDA